MLLGKKKADQMFSDQVSHQYTRWHDRLSQAVRTAMPSSAPYSVVHAENLVGVRYERLFSSTKQADRNFPALDAHLRAQLRETELERYSQDLRKDWHGRSIWQ